MREVHWFSSKVPSSLIFTPKRPSTNSWKNKDFKDMHGCYCLYRGFCGSRPCWIAGWKILPWYDETYMFHLIPHRSNFLSRSADVCFLYLLAVARIPFLLLSLIFRCFRLRHFDTQLSCLPRRYYISIFWWRLLEFPWQLGDFQHKG